ncbi:39S ribosomal protein L28, mitochondrial [Pseudolycoriella hygida]|uniref:39S ribosomal protein L28, mitochondrial n=1 Tax=Pseudolycoriella hygida TaxID=35572 RepID=A0A9Q0NA81_9DIPT|nr:39S ribosomal protein L28, mitochondrial [Pseudolycoriella hygida]
MASSTPQGAKLLYGFRRPNRFSGKGSLLPQAYMKFYKEWKTKPTPVHYIPKEGLWERNGLTGVVTPIQNIPLPVLKVPQQNEAIWGGEGVIKGFQKRTPTKKRVPYYWVPVMRRTVLKSVVLNKYLTTIVTERTMDLIHENHGFDHYLLKTPACDLNSTLAFRIKRNILEALQNNCPNVDPEKRSDIMKEYGKYLESYTPEEIEWYGYTYQEAMKKMSFEMLEDEKKKIGPHKIEFRSKLIQQLKEAGIAEAQEKESSSAETTTWLQKMNPFGSKKSP